MSHELFSRDGKARLPHPSSGDAKIAARSVTHILDSFFTHPRNIVLLALVVRLMFPSTFIFREDEARALEYALEVVRDHTFLTHTWPSNVGIVNSPIFVYVISVFAFVNPSPPFVTLCMILMNLAGVLVAYRFFTRLFDSRAEARMSVLFLAVSPMAVHYSRKIWDPAPLPLFSALLACATLSVLSTERSKWAFAIPLLICFMAQIHQSAMFFGALIVLTLALHRPRLNYPSLALGIVAGGLVLAPYLAYFIGSGFEQLGNYYGRFGSRLPDIDVATNFLLNVTGQNIYGITGRDIVSLLNWPVPGFGVLVAVASLLFLPAVYYGIRELASRSSLRFTPRYPFVRAGDAYGYNLLAVCIFGMPLLYLVFRVPGVAHYYVVIFPMLFSLLALGITRIRAGGAASRLGRATSWLPVVSILLIGCFLSMTSYRRGGHSFGPTYAFSTSIAREVVETAYGEHSPPSETDRHGPRDTLRVFLEGPRLRSNLPVQWKYVFREEFGVDATLPECEAFYQATYGWDRRLWSRGSYSVRTMPACP